MWYQSYVRKEVGCLMNNIFGYNDIRQMQRYMYEKIKCIRSYEDNFVIVFGVVMIFEERWFDLEFSN